MNSRFPGLNFVTGILLISGLLEATAIVNLGGTGVPVYYGATVLGLLWLLLWGLRDRPSISLDRTALALVAIWMAAIFGLSLLQVVTGIMDLGTVAKQLVARTMLLTYFLVCVVIFSVHERQDLLIRILKAFLLFYVLYGLFDFVGQLLGWPELLGFLRNNASTRVEFGRGEEGWLRLPRLKSLAIEPSATTIALCLFAYLMIFFERRRWLVICGLILAFMFGALTFARTAWFSAALAILMSGGAALLLRLDRSAGMRKLIQAGGLIACVIVPVAYVLMVSSVTQAFSDVSAWERSGTTIVGTRLFLAHYLTGTGFNSFPVYSTGFSAGIFDPLGIDPVYIHNGLVTFLVSLGMTGAVIFFLPLLYLASLTHIPVTQRFWWLGAFMLFGSMMDCYYYPQVWMVLAFLAACNMRSSGVLAAGSKAPAGNGQKVALVPQT